MRRRTAAAHDRGRFADAIDEVLLIVIEAYLKRWAVDDKDAVHLRRERREKRKKERSEEKEKKRRSLGECIAGRRNERRLGWRKS